MTRLVPVAVQQKRQYEETGAARDDRKKQKQPEIVAGKARRNGHDLIGNWRKALKKDDPAAPVRIGVAKSLHLVAVAIDLDQPSTNRIIENCTDSVTEQPA